MIELKVGDFVTIKTEKSFIHTLLLFDQGVIMKDKNRQGYYDVQCILETGYGPFIENVLTSEKCLSVNTDRSKYKQYAMELLKT